MVLMHNKARFCCLSPVSMSSAFSWTTVNCSYYVGLGSRIFHPERLAGKFLVSARTIHGYVGVKDSRGNERRIMANSYALLPHWTLARYKHRRQGAIISYSYGTLCGGTMDNCVYVYIYTLRRPRYKHIYRWILFPWYQQSEWMKLLTVDMFTYFCPGLTPSGFVNSSYGFSDSCKDKQGIHILIDTIYTMAGRHR